MPSHDLQSSRQIWTEYWRGGRPGCLTEEAPASAQTHVESLWRSWFGRLLQGTRILDLACGAGELARLALSVSEEAGLQFAIDGVDLAELGPATDSGSPMRLQGGTDLASLPFPDRSFDCAVSQFGIEYADVAAACRELARVMKPGGRGLFLVHHRQSAISAATASRLEAFAAVVGDGALLDAAKAVYEAISARAGEFIIAPRILEFRRALRHASQLQSSRYAWEANLREILSFLTDLARNPFMYNPSDAAQRIAAAHDMIAAWTSRLELQREAAQDEKGIRSLADCLARSGFSSGEILVVEDPATGAVLAWQLPFAAPQTSHGAL